MLIQNLLKTCTLALCLSIFSTVQAQDVSVTVAELQQAIDELEDQSDALERLAIQRLEEQLRAADLRLGDDGEILYTDSQQNILAEAGCTRTEIRQLDITIGLASSSGLEFTLQSLNEPIDLELQLDVALNASGRAKQVLGFRLGSCQEVANDNFSFNANGTALLNIALSINLNPTLNQLTESLVLQPEIDLTGQLQQQSLTVDVSDSLLRSLLEDVLEDIIDDTLDADQLLATLNELEQNLQDRINEEVENGSLAINLPSPTDPQVAKLYELLSPNGDFMLSRGYLSTRRLELLVALLSGDTDGITEILSLAAQCEAAGILQVELDHTPIYTLSGGSCQQTQIPSADSTDGVSNTQWYIDGQCLTPIDYYATTSVDYCNVALDTNRLGNGASRPSELGRWTLSPGTQFDIGALALGDKMQPFTQRVAFKSVSTPMGECALEMRIHHPTPERSNAQASFSTRRAVLALHGGSWQRRSSGALGIEAIATQFTNEGYVVFAPFYRLLGDAEGTEACNNASLEDALNDVNDALTWFNDHAAQFGVSGEPVLFGQSAGGHLASVLAVERPDEVASAVLFYAPTDFEDFAQQILDGEIETATGQRILEAVVNQTLDTLDLNSPIIQRNTLTKRLMNTDLDFPPFFLLHGREDTVLPFRQSVRFCNALAGDLVGGPAAHLTANELRNIVRCGQGVSELHLITEGEHALDLCIADELCLAGSAQSAQLTSDSMSQMLAWTKTAHLLDDLASDDPGANRSGSGGGRLSWQLIVLLGGLLMGRVWLKWRPYPIIMNPAVRF